VVGAASIQNGIVVPITMTKRRGINMLISLQRFTCSEGRHERSSLSTGYVVLVDRESGVFLIRDVSHDGNLAWVGRWVLPIAYYHDGESYCPTSRDVIG